MTSSSSVQSGFTSRSRGRLWPPSAWVVSVPLLGRGRSAKLGHRVGWPSDISTPQGRYKPARIIRTTPYCPSAAQESYYFFRSLQHATGYVLSQLEAVMRLGDNTRPPTVAKSTLQLKQDNDAETEVVLTPLASNWNPAESPATKVGCSQTSGPKKSGTSTPPLAKISADEHTRPPLNCAAHILCIASIPTFAGVATVVTPTNSLS